MREQYGNMWDMRADAKCITTNGTVKKNDEAVMGRGVAKQAAKRYPNLPKILGYALKTHGNHVSILATASTDRALIAFPVKHNWWEKGDMALIDRSLKELIDLVDIWEYKTVLLPKPGCGNGQLSWSKDVKKLCEPVLDDRFVVVDF